MKHLLLTLLLLTAGVTCALAQRSVPAGARSNPDHTAPDSLGSGCRNLPPIDPSQDFVTNFNNSCYAQPLIEGKRGHYAGDLNARYGLVLYNADPAYEMILLGTFPNARFFSVTAYDSHSVSNAGMIDSDVLPLTASMTNPLLPGATFVPNQLYGITIGYGGKLTPNVTPGCSTNGTTIAQNFLDASQIHQGLSWNGYPGLPKNFPVHLTGVSSGGSLFVRSYLDISSEAAPVVIIRDLSTGCAVPLSDTKGLISASSGNNPWNDPQQESSHEKFATSIETKECFPQDPINSVQWNRSPDFIPGYNTAAAYLSFDIASSKVKSLVSGKQFIRMRFQLATTPPTPCSDGNCSRTGSEQLRYRSISFLTGADTLASLPDSNMVRDENGNVTLIIGMGTKPPSFVTAANNYTYFDLSSVSSYKDLSQVTIRDILPSSNFQCSAFNTPFFYTEYNPEGGYMGNYVPTVDYPTGDALTTVPVPIVRANTCAAVVTQTPVACTTQ